MSHTLPITALLALSTTDRGIDRALAALEQLATELGLHPVDDLALVRVTLDPAADIRHTRVQQTHQGVPVFGAEAVVHMHLDGRLRGITDTLVADVQVDTQPFIRAEQALSLALADAGLEQLELAEAPTAELAILPGEDDRLVWKVRLVQAQNRILVTLVDAHDGSIAQRHDAHFGYVSADLSSVGSTWYLADVTRDRSAFTRPGRTLRLTTPGDWDTTDMGVQLAS